jgi:hypothetical protein
MLTDKLTLLINHFHAIVLIATVLALPARRRPAARCVHIEVLVRLILFKAA